MKRCQARKAFTRGKIVSVNRFFFFSTVCIIGDGADCYYTYYTCTLNIIVFGELILGDVIALSSITANTYITLLFVFPIWNIQVWNKDLVISRWRRANCCSLVTRIMNEYIVCFSALTNIRDSYRITRKQFTWVVKTLMIIRTSRKKVAKYNTDIGKLLITIIRSEYNVMWI